MEAAVTALYKVAVVPFVLAPLGVLRWVMLTITVEVMMVRKAGYIPSSIHEHLCSMGKWYDNQILLASQPVRQAMWVLVLPWEVKGNMEDQPMLVPFSSRQQWWHHWW